SGRGLEGGLEMGPRWPGTANIAKAPGPVGRPSVRTRKSRTIVVNRPVRGLCAGLWTARCILVSRRAARRRGAAPGPRTDGARAQTESEKREAHLSAQEAQARPHPRVSCPYEHACRPARAQAPPRQGPQATDRLRRAAALPHLDHPALATAFVPSRRRRLSR